jgi:hypothetical protein
MSAVSPPVRPPPAFDGTELHPKVGGRDCRQLEVRPAAHWIVTNSDGVPLSASGYESRCDIATAATRVTERGLGRLLIAALQNTLYLFHKGQAS